MAKRICTVCRGTKCIECPDCEGKGSSEYKTCKKCKPSPFNFNPCGVGSI